MFNDIAPDIRTDRTEEGNGYHSAKRALANGSPANEVRELIEHESTNYQKGAKKALDEA